MLPQGRSDLGRRMAPVVRGLPLGAIIMTGSDIPEIATSDIEHDVWGLGHKAAILRPAIVGCYWLIGSRRRAALCLPTSKRPVVERVRAARYSRQPLA